MTQLSSYSDEHIAMQLIELRNIERTRLSRAFCQRLSSLAAHITCLQLSAIEATALLEEEAERIRTENEECC
ncbi:DUF2732 family protein [[Enterobacter] lignolyticus]|uniref:DUF2732 family protein n=2 Tax=[Enterobacter] lignolyticus TaxID=1334193 RepID=E3G7R9_ENTLS|nr:DUF2732 family protein [[Enterobacter] lignolyticus]ADO47410.1 hypothetical protein Entcl_1143 [[Enterobacter] lignolyticus SCF1]ALR77753.1 hypothetical protein AO703_16125 [[Enterobacter] lignolyticus]